VCVCVCVCVYAVCARPTCPLGVQRAGPTFTQALELLLGAEAQAALELVILRRHVCVRARDPWHGIMPWQCLGTAARASTNVQQRWYVCVHVCARMRTCMYVCVHVCAHAHAASAVDVPPWAPHWLRGR